MDYDIFQKNDRAIVFKEHKQNDSRKAVPNSQSVALLGGRSKEGGAGSLALAARLHVIFYPIDYIIKRGAR